MSPVRRFYRPELDGLRFFAFLFVFVAHAVKHAPSWVGHVVHAGFFGVDLFFVLSAYLITELLLREIDERGRLDVPAFWIRRALRIWPLYGLLWLLLVLVLPSERPEPRYAVAYALFAGNWACAAWGFPRSSISPLWSVSVEEQFYLLWPLALRLVPRKRLSTVAAAMLIVAQGARGYLWWSAAPHPAAWCNTLARLDPIALGVLIALALRSELPRLGRAARLGLALGSFLLWVLADRYAPVAGGPGPAMIGLPLAALGGAGLLVAALGAGGVLTARPLVYLGRISYGLYALHVLAIHLSRRLHVAAPAEWLAALALTVVLAALSYHLYEQRFLRLKLRFTHVASRPGG